MPLQTDATVTENKRIKPSYFALGIYCPPIADRIKPGQFVMLKVSDDHSPLLRRPFSVYKSYPKGHPEKRKRGHLIILYKEVGRGTRKMTSLKTGQKVDLIGPLGNGFTLPPLPSSGSTILIGGGMGIVSLYPLVEAFEAGRLFVFVGGKAEHDVLCVEDFSKFSSNIFIATEDGSLGFQGTVVDLFLSQKERFKGKKEHFLYACGPFSMLKAIAGVAEGSKFVSQASLEARMGCGFGACWGCVVKTKHPKTPYQRVCEDGPVFRLQDIAWE
ncbi:MAG TPA: dihydroorotate dehydrogenase electron transfer subunit [Thermodesulfobacteriota bacterium]|nr:dihydroorotate dehydrogenase electron transfer subunit [Thermodesulfobacteriota bacterium]